MIRVPAIVLCLCLVLTGCSPGEGPDVQSAMDDSMDEAFDRVTVGFLVISAGVYALREHRESVRAKRPRVEIDASKQVKAGDSVTVEVTYWDKDKLVRDWWYRHPHAMSIGREGGSEALIPDSIAPGEKGSLVASFRADHPGVYLVQVETHRADVPLGNAKSVTARRKIRVR